MLGEIPRNGDEGNEVKEQIADREQQEIADKKPLPCLYDAVGLYQGVNPSRKAIAIRQFGERPRRIPGTGP